MIFRKARKAVDLLALQYWLYLPKFTLRRAYLPLSDIQIKKPIFILGTQGGGLTLITRSLLRHPSAVSCSGNNRFWAGRDEMHKTRYHDLPSVLRLKSKNNATDFIHPNFGNHVSFLYASSDYYDHYRIKEDEFNEIDCNIVQLSIKTYLRAYAHSIDTARYIDKSQSFALKIPWLKRCFPDAKFVLITRNPYANCIQQTTLKKLQRLNALRNHDLTYNELLSLHSEHWKNTYETALNDLENIDHHFLRFEDFLAEPESHLQTLLEYLELPYNGDLLPAPHHHLPLGSVSRKKWYPVNPNPNKKYLEKLDHDMIRKMQNMLDPLAKDLGYEAPE